MITKKFNKQCSPDDPQANEQLGKFTNYELFTQNSWCLRLWLYFGQRTPKFSFRILGSTEYDEFLLFEVVGVVAENRGQPIFGGRPLVINDSATILLNVRYFMFVPPVILQKVLNQFINAWSTKLKKNSMSLFFWFSRCAIWWY